MPRQHIASRAIVAAAEDLAPGVQFEITEPTGDAVGAWIGHAGPANYVTYTLRRTKATPIYRRTKNRRAAQLRLGRTRLESTVRYLGIEVSDALEMA